MRPGPCGAARSSAIAADARLDRGGSQGEIGEGARARSGEGARARLRTPLRRLPAGVASGDGNWQRRLRDRTAARHRTAPPLPPQTAVRADRMRAARARTARHRCGCPAAAGRPLCPRGRRPALVPVLALRLMGRSQPAGSAHAELPAGARKRQLAVARPPAPGSLCAAGHRRGTAHPLPGAFRAGRGDIPVRGQQGHAEQRFHADPQGSARRRRRTGQQHQPRAAV